MKRLAVILLVIALAGMVFPGPAVMAQPEKTPHENPDTATDALDSLSLLLNYGRIILLISAGQYEDALAVLEEMGTIDLPDELRNIADRYNDLCRQLAVKLDELETLLEETAALIESNRIDEARICLDEAAEYIEDAVIILDDILSATEELNQRLGVFSLAAPEDVTAAYDRLQESIAQLQALIEKLDGLREELNQDYIEISGLLPTELTLTVSPDSAYVGDSVPVSGSLVSEGEPLAGRSVAVTIDEDNTSYLTTDDDGAYGGDITVPFNYVNVMDIVAVYTPSGDDAAIYLADRSPEVTLEVLFYTTQLEITAPGTAYPGLPFTIAGDISTDGNEAMRDIEVSLDGTLLAGLAASGQFSPEITLPEATPLGQKSLEINVLPLGRYAGVSRWQSINVSQLPLTLDLATPGMLFLPGTIRLDGSVGNELGPVSGAEVNISFSDVSTTAVTAADGRFTATLKVPLDFSFLGQRGLNIEITPLEPWSGTLDVSRQIFIINPVTSGLVLAAALGLVIYALTRRRRKGAQAVPEGEPAPAPLSAAVRAPAVKLTGIRGSIIAAYRAGLAVIERISGLRMTPENTLREFLVKATRLFPILARPLTELTALAERALYANRQPSQQSAAAAARLTDDIKEEMRRGAT